MAVPIASGAKQSAGTGLTLTTLNQSGGIVVLQGFANTPTLVNKTAGTLTINAGSVTTVTNDGGRFNYNGVGTITTLNISDGAEANFTQDMSDRTVTNANLYKGGSIIDNFKTVTWTNGVDLVRCGLNEVSLDLGIHVTITPSAV